MALDIRIWNLGGVLALAACGSSKPADAETYESGDFGCDGTCCSAECGGADDTPEPECIDNSDCPDLNVCIDGYCAPGDTADPDSAGPEGCNGTCCSDDCGYDPDSGEESGGYCGSDGDCFEGACIGGACASGTLIPLCTEALDVTAFPIEAAELSPGGINGMLFVELEVDAQATLVFSDGVRLGTATADATTTLYDLDAIDEPWVIAAADFDGDGTQDLLVRDLTDGISATYSVGTGVPVHMATFASDNPPWVRDMDGDGLPDLLLFYPNDGLAVLEGLGNGSFGEPSFVDLMVSANIIGHVDVDGDARTDLLSSARDLYFLDVNYVAEQTVEVETMNPELEPYGLALADLGGVRDLVIASGLGGGVLIEHATEQGTLLGSYVSSTAGSFHGVANFVGSGDRDVVVERGVVTGLPDAPCLLEFAPTLAVSSAIGDFDGDPRDEIMIRDASDNALYIARATP